MSRDSGLKFTPASKGDTYDKMSCCSQCLKEPGTKPFAVCSACKEISFCSRDCQIQAWPVHKTVCQMRKNTIAAKAHAPSSATFPPFIIRKRLLTDFIEAHECTFRSGFTSALTLEGGIENFPFDRRVLTVMLRYRPDCNENPSVAYSVLGHTWTTSAEMTARFGYMTDALELEIDARMRVKADYRGLLRVYFRMEDNIVQELYPQIVPQGLEAILHRAATATVNHTQWMTRVQRFVNDGLVMRAPGEHEAVMQLGRLKIRKGKWVWVQLTPAELLEFGYPSDFTGLLF
ncbi:hypothetical protein B0H17DRAFT_1337998 [Mycena rosella]|uniref:MYND-type domain-containing protein n=1 Tax=Mycena rosella TaxID=1033263 RepID=A0AAD7CPA6_MYCRO|nr:hypothetical protein B0H17DRAFT_1337998 [Mycena rosella]